MPTPASTHALGFRSQTVSRTTALTLLKGTTAQKYLGDQVLHTVRQARYVLYPVDIQITGHSLSSGASLWPVPDSFPFLLVPTLQDLRLLMYNHSMELPSQLVSCSGSTVHSLGAAVRCPQYHHHY